MSENGEVTNERGHFLTESQKRLKQKIMEDLMIALFGNIQTNQCQLDLQSVLDLTMSILIMFNRDVLVHTFTSCNLTHVRKDIMKQLFDNVKEQVNTKIKQGMM